MKSILTDGGAVSDIVADRSADPFEIPLGELATGTLKH